MYGRASLKAILSIHIVLATSFGSVFALTTCGTRPQVMSNTPNMSNHRPNRGGGGTFFATL